MANLENLELRIKALENAAKNNGISYPLDQHFKGIIENSQFNILQALTFKGGLKKYTSARDITVDIPKDNEIWVEDVSGPTRRLCVYLVNATTGVGAKYSVTVT